MFGGQDSVHCPGILLRCLSKQKTFSSPGVARQAVTAGMAQARLPGGTGTRPAGGALLFGCTGQGAAGGLISCTMRVLRINTDQAGQ